MYWEDTATNIQLKPLKNGESLYFCGSTGVGKTHAAARLVKARIMSSLQLYGESQFVNFSKVAMLHVGKLLDNLKRSFNGGGMTEGELMDFYETCDLLVLDDLGADKLTDWGVSKIFEIVDARYSNNRSTIVTSNFTPGNLFERFSGTVTAKALASRLCTFKIKQMEGVDRRL